MWIALAVIAFFSVEGNAKSCVPYTVGNTVIACICNATYCDDTPDNVPKIPKEGNSYWYVTNKEGLRMEMSKAKFGTNRNYSPNVTLTIDTKKRYQTILGFGGAFTDATGINLKKLSPATQDQMMRAYFCSKTGSAYNLGRIPIAGTDFSTRPYTYDDVENDITLKHFALTREDYDYKIPYLKKARELNPETKFFATAWSAPGWMKTNGVTDGYGLLKKNYYQVYTNYIMKFLDQYRQNGLDIWAVTTGNEPSIGIVSDISNFTSMAWTPQSMADWVANFLGPTLASSMNNDTVVIALDDDKFLLPWFVEPLFENKNASKCTVGIGVHWYFENKAPIWVLDETHEEFPDKFILSTESSIRETVWGTPNVATKSWTHAERYILSLIEYINHWSVGWVDFNLALDEKGGPTWIKNYLDAAIIVNSYKDEFYKMPSYYALKHFSRFVKRDSVRVSITDTDTIKSVGFVTPAKEVVVVLYNSDSFSNFMSLKDVNKDELQLELSPYSMNTIIYKQ